MLLQPLLPAGSLPCLPVSARKRMPPQRPASLPAKLLMTSCPAWAETQLFAEGAVATVVLCLFGPGTVKRGIATEFLDTGVKPRYFRGILLILPRHDKTGPCSFSPGTLKRGMHGKRLLLCMWAVCGVLVGHASPFALWLPRGAAFTLIVFLSSSAPVLLLSVLISV